MESLLASCFHEPLLLHIQSPPVARAVAALVRQPLSPLPPVLTPRGGAAAAWHASGGEPGHKQALQLLRTALDCLEDDAEAVRHGLAPP